MAFVFPPPPAVSLGIKGTEERFPVHRIYCVGRNYAAHAVEMGHDPDKEPPFFFQKNPDNLVPAGVGFPYPDKTYDLHHEIELVVALSGGGKDIPVDEALGCVYGYAVGLDMTRRDLQGQMKKAGRPWEIGKAFEHSAPCSDIVRAEQIGHPQSGRVWLEVNGKPRQEGDLNQLIWKNAETIAYLSGLFELQAGDLIFTGTPSGVAAVEKGDQLVGGVEGVGELSVMVI